MSELKTMQVLNCLNVDREVIVIDLEQFRAEPDKVILKLLIMLKREDFTRITRRLIGKTTGKDPFY